MSAEGRGKKRKGRIEEEDSFAALENWEVGRRRSREERWRWPYASRVCKNAEKEICAFFDYAEVSAFALKNKQNYGFHRRRRRRRWLCRSRNKSFSLRPTPTKKEDKQINIFFALLETPFCLVPNEHFSFSPLPPLFCLTPRCREKRVSPVRLTISSAVFCFASSSSSLYTGAKSPSPFPPLLSPH